MRICCFCELWESGGIESFLNNLLHNIDLHGTEVDIVAARIGESIFTEPLEKIGVRFVQLSGNPRSPKNHSMFKRLLRERKYDAVHFNIFQAFAFYYVKLAKDAGVPSRIVHAHGAGLRKSRTRAVKLLLHRIGRILWKKNITRRLACSNAAAQFLFGEEADEIIANGIDTDRFEYSPEQREKIRYELGTGSSYLVGHVGRFSAEKNQEFLLGAHKELLKLVPNARLLLVGDGETRDGLAELAERLGVSDSVIFYGSSDNVPALLCAMDVFVFPSFFEGLGIVAVEAQCSGLPVICSEFIPDDAYLTELATKLPLSLGAEAWARKESELLLNRGERTSRSSDITARGFDTASSARQMEKYYKIIL